MGEGLKRAFAAAKATRQGRSSARIKPLSEMSKEELTEAINDPLGPDYTGYKEAAMIEKAKR